MQQKLDEIIKTVDSKIDNPLVSAKFGDDWKQFVKDQIDKKSDYYDLDNIIDIAWRQGRRAILLEQQISNLLQNQTLLTDIKKISKYKTPELNLLEPIAWSIEDIEENEGLIQLIGIGDKLNPFVTGNVAQLQAMIVGMAKFSNDFKEILIDAVAELKSE